MPSATVTANSPTSPPLDLQITRLKTGAYSVVVYESEGVPYDLTTAALYFHASGYGITINKSTSDGITTGAAPEEGKATIVIAPADTSSFNAGGTFAMECELTMVDGSPAGTYQLAAGTLTVSPNVGTP